MQKQIPWLKSPNLTFGKIRNKNKWNTLTSRGDCERKKERKKEWMNEWEEKTALSHTSYFDEIMVKLIPENL